MRRSWLKQIQTEAKQKALQNLQDYTHNLKAMYNSLRSFKHDYINISPSLSGYIENCDMDELKKYFKDKIFPTKNLIDQGDYKLDNFLMDTVDLARILGIFLDNAIEATLETEQSQIGLNIIQNKAGVSITISNHFRDDAMVLHKLKQKGFNTKPGHQGIGLSNTQKIIHFYNNVLIEELDMQLVLDAGDPYVLLNKVKTSQNTGIYFLDIDLNCDMSGMKLAQQIRLFDPHGFIIKSFSMGKTTVKLNFPAP